MHSQQSLRVFILPVSGDNSGLGQVPPRRSLKEEPSGIAGARFFYRLDALLVAQPTVLIS